MTLSFNALLVFGVVTGLSSPALAADLPPPDPLPVHAPTVPAYKPDGTAIVETNPEVALLLMAARLARNANSVVLEVGNRPVSLGDVADVVGNLPLAVAALGFEDVYKRSLEELYRQEAMVTGAIEMGVDKDPMARRRARAAIDRTLANEWLNRAVDAQLTEQMIKDRYQRDVAGKSGPPEVRARVILVPTYDQAMKLLTRLKAGEDFGTLARQQSQDASAAAAGDLGFLRQGALTPELGAVIFALQVRQMTAYPVPTSAGFFIARIEGRRDTGPLSYDEARSDVRRDLRRELAADVIRAREAVVAVRTYGVGEHLLPPELRVPVPADTPLPSK